jgi:hypothetical protein
MNNKAMIPAEGVHESTYALLMRSEEKQRGIFEIVVFTLFILCAVFSLWQFAGQSVAFPLSAVNGADSGDSAKPVQHCEARS